MMFHAVGDFDGDGGWEAAAVYRHHGELVITAYKHNGWAWAETDSWRGSGCEIHAFYAAPSITRGYYSHSLIIGWSRDGMSCLSVYDWLKNGLEETARYSFPAASASAGESPADPFPRSAGLYPASVKTAEGVLWGYVDASGRMALPPVYTNALDFQDNGLAVVEKGGKNGVIDSTGRFVVEPVYDSISPFKEGLAAASDKSGARVIDQSGRVITPKSYSFIMPYSEGRALFYVSGQDGSSNYGYLDREGREAVPAKYQEGTDFRQGKAVVKVKEKEYRLIGPNGEKLASYPYWFVGPLSEGLLAFQAEKDSKYGYMDEKGAVVIKPAFTGAQPFEGERAVVNVAENYGALYGLIDKNGHFVIRPAYKDIRLLGEDRAALGKPVDPAQPYIGTRYAIADLNGRMLTGFDYYDVEDFKEGLASVNNGRETFFINTAGRRAPGLPAVSGTGSLAFDGSLIKAQVDNRTSYLDRSGRVVWAQNTVIPLAPPYQVRELKYKPNKDYLVYYPQVEGMGDKAAEGRVNARLKELSGVKPVNPTQQLEHSYTGDFQVVFFRRKLLELLLDSYDYPFGAAHGMPGQVYARIDLDSGRFYELKDLFKPGSDYVKRISGIIGDQIRNNPEYSYVWLDSYKGIAADQLFYVTGDDLHILFTPYEIAPYAAGFPEFIIPFAELEDILDKNGAFWRSFH